MAERTEVRAAGGLVVRNGDGGVQVAVVHRPRYDDWSLPKGKLEGEETFELAALREIDEETGYRCEIERDLGLPNRYTDHKGRPKVVRWYLMRPLEGAFEPNAEVDEMRWLAPAEAIALLDYEHERSLVATLGH